MTLSIFKDMTMHTRNPFRIVEKFDTIDGTRCRLTHECFATHEEAHAFIMKAEAKEGASEESLMALVQNYQNASLEYEMRGIIYEGTPEHVAFENADRALRAAMRKLVQKENK